MDVSLRQLVPPPCSVPKGSARGDQHLWITAGAAGGGVRVVGGVDSDVPMDCSAVLVRCVSCCILLLSAGSLGQRVQLLLQRG